MIDTSSIQLETHFPKRFHDVMGGASRIQAKVHEHGHVALIDCMPRLIAVDDTDGVHSNGIFTQTGEMATAETAIVQAARVSYQNGTKKVQEDTGLTRYLMRKNHNTPVEMVETKWHCKMPIFIARQWIRHRTASVNEVSARYSELPGEFWVPSPEDLRVQSTQNKQVSEGQFNQVDAKMFILSLRSQCETAYQRYEYAMKQGLGREQARVGLPLNIYTEWYWKIDLHNLFHFLALRVHPHAQKEIRDYALPMFKMVQMIAPIAAEAFVDYRVDNVNLTGPEVRAIMNRQRVLGKTKREQAEFEEKIAALGLNELLPPNWSDNNAAE
jgi:thymidylate synthase (FAD)